MQKTIEITPLILAGGKSSRMGENKAFVTLKGIPFIEIIIQKLNRVFVHKPIIVTNSPQLYGYLGVQTVVDVFSGQGPLAGIHAGLLASTTDFSFVCGCDMPLLDTEFIAYMAAAVTAETDIIIPRYKGQCEPLHAIYSRNCLDAIEGNLAKGDRKLTSLLSLLSVRYINEAEIQNFPHGCQSFCNVNTKEEMQIMERLISAAPVLPAAANAAMPTREHGVITLQGSNCR